MDCDKAKKKQKDIYGCDTREIIVPLQPSQNDLTWPAGTPGFKRTRVNFNDLFKKNFLETADKLAVNPPHPKPSPNSS